jgi:hypothetical protein
MAYKSIKKEKEKEARNIIEPINKTVEIKQLPYWL